MRLSFVRGEHERIDGDLSHCRGLHFTEVKSRAAKRELKRRVAQLPPGMRVLLMPYLQDPWNALDFAIVIVSIISLFDIPAIESLRALRALRPLRLVSRYPDLKITVDTLVLSIPAMVNGAHRAHQRALQSHL